LACRRLPPAGTLSNLDSSGEQGSAKSTTAKLLRRILDPAQALLRTPPRDERDLLIAANNSWVIAYDNLSGIQPWLSDALCRLATGGGFSKRELYTNTDEIILDLTRPLILNGIDHLAERADLADRSIILNLPSIGETERRDEAQLYAEYEAERPKIIGALFAAISAALANLPTVNLSHKPRMADFAMWATAAELALGLPPGTFFNAYSGNRADAVQETLESDAIGVAVLALISEEAGECQWSGTAWELLEQLERGMDDRKRKLAAWPKSPRGLSSRLRRLAPFLRESHIEVTFHPEKRKGQRMLTVARIPAHSTVPTVSTAKATFIPEMNQPVVLGLAQEGPLSARTGGRDRPEQPPIEPPKAMSLNEKGVPIERTVGTVQYGTILDGADEDRIDLCVTRGPTEWQWSDGAWICGSCGKPAKRSRAERSRSES
jgi:hypothetical protein